MIIKEITENFDENSSEKITKMVVSDDAGVETEILLKGEGKLKVTASV